MKFLLSLLLILGLVGCSGSKSLEESADTAGIDMPEQDEFAEDFADDGFGDDAFADDGFAEESGDELAGEVSEQVDEFAEDSFDSFEEPAANTEPTEMVSEFSDGGTGMEAPMAPTMADGSGSHTVQSGETLMLIAFKIYGDYEKWRELARLNSGKLGPRYTVSTGTVLSYNPPAQAFQWNPTGNPYLIKVGDTLGTVSADTYGTTKYWRAIWENNTPLIKDPNKIFAGFTIYTPIVDGREVANESF